MSKVITNESYHRECREKAVSLATALLHDQDTFLENIFSLLSLQLEITDGVYDDDFTIYYIIQDETDHMPLGAARKYFSDGWIKKCDAELRNIRNVYRDQVELSCNNIVQRFGDGE